jgi:hypothetical protein
MKSILFSLAFCTTYLTATGQTGFFLQPILGGGSSNTIFINVRDVREKTMPVPMFNSEVSVGYQFQNFVVNTGLGYMRTGFKQLKPPIGNYSVEYRINHIVLPLLVGYRLRTTSKIAVMPALGIDIAYNNTGRLSIVYWDGGFRTKTERLPHKKLKNSWLELSVFALAELRLEYKLSPQLAVMCIPRVAMSIDNMENHSTKISGFNNLYNYAMMFDGGFKWTFLKRKHSEETKIPAAE